RARLVQGQDGGSRGDTRGRSGSPGRGAGGPGDALRPVGRPHARDRGSRAGAHRYRARPARSGRRAPPGPRSDRWRRLTATLARAVGGPRARLGRRARIPPDSRVLVPSRPSLFPCPDRRHDEPLLRAAHLPRLAFPAAAVEPSPERELRTGADFSRRSRLRRARFRGRLLERAPVGVVVRADGKPAALHGGARGGQPDGLALRDPGAAWLAATSRSTGASAIRPRPPSPSAGPARPAA